MKSTGMTHSGLSHSGLTQAGVSQSAIFQGGMSLHSGAQPVGLSQPGGGPVTRLRATPALAAFALIVLTMLLVTLVMVSPQGQGLVSLGYRIPLPSGPGVPPPGYPTHILSVDLNQKLWLDGKPLENTGLEARLAELAAANPPVVLRIQGNAQLYYADVQALVARAHTAGIASVALELDAGVPTGPSLEPRSGEPSAGDGSSENSSGASAQPPLAPDQGAPSTSGSAAELNAPAAGAPAAGAPAAGAPAAGSPAGASGETR